MSVDSETLRDEKLKYRWHAGYSRADEYDKNPQWAIEMRSAVCDGDDGGAYSRQTIRIYDKYDPEHMWIRSDTAYDLTQMI
jgi:hypothetical protein